VGRRHADGDRRRLTDPQDAIAGIVDGYVADGVTPELPTARRLRGRMRAVRRVDRPAARGRRDGLRGRLLRGPREASTAAVADELGLDPSTVAEHLQRAERSLTVHHLEGA